MKSTTCSVSMAFKTVTNTARPSATSRCFVIILCDRAVSGKVFVMWDECYSCRNCEPVNSPCVSFGNLSKLFIVPTASINSISPSAFTLVNWKCKYVGGLQSLSLKKWQVQYPLIEQTCLIFTSEHSRSRHVVWCWGDFHIFSASEDIQPGDVGLCVTVLPSLGNADLDHLRTEMLSVKNNSSNKNNNKPKRVTFRWHFWTTIPCMVCP